MALLEYVDSTGTTYFEIPPEDYQLVINWKKIDCGCAGYAAARRSLAPAMKELRSRLTPVRLIKLNTEIIRFLDGQY